MERQTKPENLYIKRNRALTAIAAAVCLILTAAIAALFAYALIKYPPDSRKLIITLSVCVGVCSAILLYLCALNIRNLFFPYILTADEKGIYNYSGYFHFGFIDWKDIAAFGKGPTILDVLDNEMPSIRIFVHDFKSFKASLPFIKKWHIFWSGCNIKIYTVTSQIKRKQLLPLLETMLEYYGTPEETKVDNG